MHVATTPMKRYRRNIKVICSLYDFRDLLVFTFLHSELYIKSFSQELSHW